MLKTESDTLRVDVPVGFLLAEPREITVSVDRADDAPLAIRLRLIPAQACGGPPDSAPRLLSALRRRRAPAAWEATDGGYPHPDVGGGD
jgi:hypothetical protein